MSDLTLSQDEIDALLTGSSTPPTKKSISPSLDSAFKGILTEALGSRAAAVAGMMEGKTFTLGTPTLELVDRDGLLDNLPQEVVELKSSFSGDTNAEHALYLSPQDAITLISPVMGQKGVELNGGTINALEEVASMMMGSLATSLGNKSKKNVTPGPVQGQKTVKAMLQTPMDEMILVKYPVTMDSGSFTLFETFPQSFAQSITGASGSESKTTKVDPASFGDFGASAGAPNGGQGNFGNPYGAPMGGQQGYQQNMPQQGMPQYGMPQQGYPQGGYGGVPAGGWPNVQGVQFPSLVPSGAGSEQGNIGLLMDVAMEVTVELGRAKRQIKDILGMGEGTIIQLDKLAGEAVDILVNHKLIAKGEVVVIDENFGVRVTEIVSQPEKFNEN